MRFHVSAILLACGGLRVAPAASQAASRIITYKPPASYTTYAASHEPGIHIRSGDTVRMNTADFDGTRIVPAPIFVDSAARGDILAVRILAIRTAARAHSARALQLDWFTTEFARGLADPPAPAWNWILDTLTGVARLDATCRGCSGPGYQRLADLRIPLRPHLGNIGVAPPGREAAANAPEEGEHGGNFDYPGIEAGVTLYLPVYHPGGLLSIASDVHAAQGDGELTCSGLETTAEIDFTVSIVRGANSTRIRAESATHLMAFGISGELKQSLQVANSNLAEWLQRDYGSTTQGELGALLGSALAIDVANVCGNQSTVVAKIAKQRLPTKSQ